MSTSPAVFVILGLRDGARGFSGEPEGSIFPYRNGGFAAYVWVVRPDGRRIRKYVYGRTRDVVHAKWIALHEQARRGPVATSAPTVATYLAYWLAEVVWPNLRPKTSERYAMHVRLHIAPGLGAKRLDRLSVQDVRTWVIRLATTCQCCAQAKDRSRPPDRQCCSAGRCCAQTLSRQTIGSVRGVLGSALGHAMSEELVTRNVAALVKLPPQRRRHVEPWSVEEARRFLASARSDGDPMFAAYVLILVLGLRRGEVLALAWPRVDLDRGEVEVTQGLQRIDGRLVLGEVETDASDARLPLPGMCVAALRLRRDAQERDKRELAAVWPDSFDLVFTSKYAGTARSP
jgi:integrase